MISVFTFATIAWIIYREIDFMSLTIIFFSKNLETAEETQHMEFEWFEQRLNCKLQRLSISIFGKQ